MNNTLRYAGFWQRVVAHLIDSLLTGTLLFILLLPLWGVIGVGFIGFDFQDSPAGILLIVLGCIAGMVFGFFTRWLYYAIMESSSQQATVGKIVLRLKVTDLRGERITFARASGRYCGRILSGMFLGIGYLMAAFTQQKQTLHDIVAGTLVIEK